MSDVESSFEELVASASGEAPERDADRLAAALRDPAAAATVAQLQRVFRLLRNDETKPVPVEARRAAWAAFRQRRPAVSQWLAAAQRVVARLVADSRAQVALAGYRGTTPTYRLAYESAGGRIDLQVLPSKGIGGPSCRIRGQFTPSRDVVPSGVALVESGSSKAVAMGEADESGCFNLDVEPGSYDLLIRLAEGDRVVVVPDVSVRPKEP